MLGLRLRATFIAGSLAAVACAGAAKSPQNSSSIAKPSTTPVRLATPRERLVSALRSIPRPDPVLDALPPEAQTRLQARLAGLDAERKLSVHSDDSALAETLPLLHLASGGTSPRALYALATTSAGSEELLGLGLESEPANPAPEALLVTVARELAQRAALNFLRDRAADAATTGKGSALVCRLVARAAQAVGRRDVLLLARELLADTEPNTDNRREFAEELARSGDPERAARVLDELRKDKARSPREDSLSKAERLIDDARAATAPAAAGADTNGRLARARAWLRLGRVSEARATLEPDLAIASTRLDLAAAVAETRTDNPSCPGLPPDVGSARLCALAFESSRQFLEGRALLEAAWQRGAGRDDEAIEVYVALDQVLPWLYETAGYLARGALSPEQSAARVLTLRAKIQEISSAAPWLQGLSLFLETVHSGAPVAERSGSLGDVEAKALTARALSLASNPNRFAQAGVLAVAATLSHQQDISALIDALPSEQIVPSLHVPRASLEVWAAVTGGALPRMDAARTELAAIMTSGQGESLDRARLVLTVSEADALFDPSQRSYQLLSRVAGQLLSDNIPPDLALRAVLDASGALAHGERFEQAQKILAGAANAELPPDLPRAQDLLQLIRGYQLVLSLRGASPEKLPQARAEFAALASAATGETARVWFEIWGRELEAVQADVKCAKKKAGVCREADALRRDVRRSLDTRLGAAASSVLLRGALPSGSFDAGFRFSVENGLEPLISFDPSFLAVGLPKFSAQ
jgi:hypothetical protein